MNTLKGKRFIVVMRHEKSIAAVYGFATGLGAVPINFHSFVLERDKDGADVFATKLSAIHEAIAAQNFDCLILATKINDIGRDSQLVSFLEGLKENGLVDQPVVLTHLETMDDDFKNQLGALGLNLHIVENDNLGFPKPNDPPGSVRTGMSRLGPAIIRAFCDQAE